MLPKVNQILYMQVNSIDEEEAKEELKARIADVLDEHVLIELPLRVKTGKVKRLYAGDELSAYYITEGGVKNYFITSVLGFREDVLKLVVLKKPELESITKVQRRNFLRVPAELEIAVKVSEIVQFMGYTDDVGGGGISFLCEKNIPIQVKNEASCWLLVPFKNGKVEHANFKAELVRVKQTETEQQLVMLRFIDISDRERQKIIKYCFERQLELRK
ncbi:glycosyl transferase [Paenibacillus psychroresistens]|uniref:Glycosyl transferase n=1 Tax=Paenibacillus psychroresistens TaxID=1778678 RepID=A0A6B8RNF0_9BACL|nr:glycosyl transferase [Paenibacillus psychroresistens]